MHHKPMTLHQIGKACIALNKLTGINQHKEVVVQNEPQAKERTSEKIAQENKKKKGGQYIDE